jgi:hypothetical protein
MIIAACSKFCNNLCLDITVPEVMESLLLAKKC